jgi:hypothetical protein
MGVYVRIKECFETTTHGGLCAYKGMFWNHHLTEYARYENFCNYNYIRICTKILTSMY